MKKVVSLIVIALLMVSCNQEEVLVETPEVAPEVPRSIGFDTFVDKSSRATGNSTALNDFYSAFKVYGWKTVAGTPTPIFQDHAVSYYDAEEDKGTKPGAEWGNCVTTGWYYTDIRYWDKMASAYQFCAYAPVAATDVVCKEDGQITIGSATAPVKVETKNLMATPAEQLAFTGFEFDYMTATAGSDGTYSDVSLNFKHLQAKLNIRIRLNASVTTAQVVKVMEIGVHNLGNKGYYDNKAIEGVVSGWKLATADADYVPAVTTDYPINGADSKSGYYVLEQLILPQTIQKAATESSLTEFDEACLYVEYKIGEETFKSFSPLANIFTTENTYKFEGGKQYTINVIVGPSPIKFTVAVTAWADAVEEDKEMN